MSPGACVGRRHAVVCKENNLHGSFSILACNGYVSTACWKYSSSGMLAGRLSDLFQASNQGRIYLTTSHPQSDGDFFKSKAQSLKEFLNLIELVCLSE